MIAKKFIEQCRTRAVINEKINGVWIGKSKDEICSLANNAYYKLQHMNIKKGERVAYMGKNSTEWLAWNIATYCNGNIWVPMYPEQSKEYINHILNDSGASLLVTNSIIETNCPTTPINLEHDNLDLTVNKHDLAALIYTSGTTGKPKGVKLTHNNILSNLESIENRFHGFNSKRSLNILPWSHIYGMTCELYYNMLNNTTTFICNDKHNFTDDCRSVKPESIYIVPKVLDLIKDKVESTPLRYLQPFIVRYILGGHIDYVFVGGAALSQSTRNFYIKNNIEICEGYGCSETSPLVSVNGILDKDRDINTSGKIMNNIQVFLNNNNEICVKGPSVSSGYWKQPDFKDNMYNTGDIGSINFDGFITIEGRFKDNYKLSNGKFINVNKIENIVKKYVNGNIMVFGKDSDSNKLATDTNIEPDILNKINNELDNYEKINKVIYINNDIFLNYMTPKMSIKRFLFEKDVLLNKYDTTY